MGNNTTATISSASTIPSTSTPSSTPSSKSLYQTAAAATKFVTYVNGNVIPAKYVNGIRNKKLLAANAAKIDDICATINPTGKPITAAAPAASAAPVAPAQIIQPFTVVLNEPLEANEFVGLTGNTIGLGEWQLNRAICLEPITNTNNLIWSTNVILTNCTNSTYRYFTYSQDDNGHKLIRRWETYRQPRSLHFAMNSNCDSNSHNITDIFGTNNDNDEKQQLSHGWLTHDTIIQFKFARKQMFEIYDVKQFDINALYIRLLPLNNVKNMVKVEVAKMHYGESQLHRPLQAGTPYKTGDIIIFHVTMPIALEVNFNLSFHSVDGTLLGESFIKHSMLTASEGELQLNIIQTKKSKSITNDCGVNGDNCDRLINDDMLFTVIAQLKLPYLIVKPFNRMDIKPFDFSFVHNWSQHNWPNLDVGHRGNGKSYILNPPNENENTIASFLKAYESHADMIELDVHLTADGIPIVYHDFGVRTVHHNKAVTNATDLIYILIKDLTYDELKQLRIFALINNQIIEYPSHNTELRMEQRIFPRLKDVLELLPSALGIDVEIKWPQLKIDGDVEAEQTIDKNYFIDTIIETVIKYGCGRPLIFSSFDADICTMLRFKQNIFPVMFLSMGETRKWQQFLDLRTRTFEQAINNAQAFELAGTAPHAEDFLGDNGSSMMQQALKLGQLILVWGDDCNSKEAIQYFRDIGATATCYDRADLHVPSNKTRAFFNSTDILTEFQNQCHH